MRGAAAKTPTAPSLGSDLKQVLGRAHEEATQLLAHPDGGRLDVVTWLSAHVAAFEHAVYPVAKKRVADGAALLEEDRKVVGQLTHMLRIVERAHSGDVLATNFSASRMRERLTELVQEHSAVQQRIVEALDAALDPAESTSLAKDYAEALVHAPTRPHPHLRSRLLFHLDALRDRVLDTMDGRHVPIPKLPKPHVVPGRWGSYLLGQPHQPEDEPR
jgi:hypothetical protein